MLELISNLINFFRLSFYLFLYGLPISLSLVYKSHKVGNYDKVVIHQKQLGKRLNKWLQSSGPSFIKLGQVLSTRSDLLGEVISEELTQLQDKLPPFDFKEVKHIIESELECKVSDVFSHIDTKPVAAASIAQVHKAVLKNDEIVAVKILRPNIQERFHTDLKLLYFFAKLITFISSEGKRMNLVQAVKTLEQIVDNELDLRFEASCADKLAENTKDDSFVKIPKIHWQHTSEKILTMEWIDGIRVDDRKKLVEFGHELPEIARKLSVAFFNQAYRDGFFHGDLHPGNIFVTNDGKIALVDFGIMGFLNSKERVFIAHMLYAFLHRDYDTVSKLHFDIGYIPEDQDFNKFSLACRSIGEPIIGLPTNKISVAKLLKQLFKISQQFNIELQTQLILLQKTMVTIEGVGVKINPEVNMWKLAEPWIKDWAKETFGFKAQASNFKNQFINVIKNTPEFTDKISNIIENADLILAEMEKNRENKNKEHKKKRA